MIRHINCSEIINSTRCRKNKRLVYVYSFNKDYIRFNLELYNYMNQNKSSFNKKYKEILEFQDDDFIEKTNNILLDRDLFNDNDND